MLEMWEYIQSTHRGGLQMLMGDMNAEPAPEFGGRGIRFLQGLGALNGTKVRDTVRKQSR
jgi:hypothetical protein